MSLWQRLVSPVRRRDPVADEVEIAELRAALARHLRPALRLSPLRDEGVGGGTGSRCGGTPYAEAGEEWPRCGGCGLPLDFLVQLDLRELAVRPTVAFDLCALFYCWECFPGGDGEGDASRWAARTYREPDDARDARLARPGGEGFVTRPCRIDWAPLATLPVSSELDVLDPALARRIDRRPDSPDVAEELERQVLGRERDETIAVSTVGGHPHWIQDEATPRGRDGRRFQLLAQLDSEPEPGWMFGDAGTLYLFFDPESPAELRMLVQCY